MPSDKSLTHKNRSSINCVLVCFLLLWWTPGPRAIWGGDFMSAYISRSLPKNNTGTQSRSFKQKKWKNDAYWLASLCLICCLSYTGHALLSSDVTAYSELGLHTSISNQENFLQTRPKVNLMEAFPQVRLPSWKPRLTITEGLVHGDWVLAVVNHSYKSSAHGFGHHEKPPSLKGAFICSLDHAV